jgi:hypothetical protein
MSIDSSIAVSAQSIMLTVFHIWDNRIMGSNPTRGTNAFFVYHPIFLVLKKKEETYEITMLSACLYICLCILHNFLGLWGHLAVCLSVCMCVCAYPHNFLGLWDHLAFCLCIPPPYFLGLWGHLAVCVCVCHLSEELFYKNEVCLLQLGSAFRHEMLCWPYCLGTNLSEEHSYYTGL